MKKSTFSTLLALLLSLNFFGQKIKSIEPIGGLPSKKIDFCGAIKYKEQPIKKCLDLNHFIEDENGSKIHNPTEEFEDRFGNIYCNYITNHLQKESRVRRQAGDFSVLVPTALGNELKIL